MKVIFVVKSYWPDSGGVQSVTRYIAEGLAKKGHEVIILTSYTDDCNDININNGVYIMRIKVKNFLKFSYGDKKKFQNYLLANNDASAIITVCAQSFAAEWFFPIIDKIKGKKIMYMHGMREEHINLHKIYSGKNFLKEFLLITWWRLYFIKNWKSILKYDTCIHLYKNDTSYSYFKKYGFKNNIVIENSCDNIFFEKSFDSNIPIKYGIKNDYFIQVANYDENKNQLLSIEAFCKADSGSKEMVLIGSQKNRYLAKINKYISHFSKEKQSKIHILTDIPRTDTIQLIKNSFSILLSSHSEYFPISIIEGMACGKPFISTSVGVVPTLVGGHVVNNINEFIYWIEYYNNYPDYANQLGNLGKCFASEKLLLINKINDFENIIK